MRFDQCYEDYCLAKELQGVSKNTLARYHYSIRRVGVDLGNPEIEEVTTVHLRGWLMSRTYGEVSRSIDIKNLRTFFRWTVAEGYREDDPTVRIPTPRLPDLEPKSIPDADVKKLVEAARRSGPRDVSIVLCLLDSAIRASELSALNRSDIDPDTGVIRVIQGKGGRSRTAFCGPITCRAVRRYLSTRKDNDPSLFLSQRGEPLNRDSLRHILYRLCDSAGIPRRGPHSLRHTSASLMARAGIDCWSLQQLLGHRDGRVSARYIWLSQTNIQSAHRRFSPVSVLR